MIPSFPKISESFEIKKLFEHRRHILLSYFYFTSSFKLLYLSSADLLYPEMEWQIYIFWNKGLLQIPIFARSTVEVYFIGLVFFDCHTAVDF